ncbi:MAG: hypothetical protein MUC91_11870 [Verrucomicrobia bacterium]|jgi:hypothetical protein|nr:hypothetical protein [Verrucomicrobiota bacterium]
MNRHAPTLSGLVGLLALLLLTPRAFAWDYNIHRLVNELAVASLPTNFPAFVREPANVERIAFLSGEADRWRNSPDLCLNHVNRPDHYIDIEDLEVYHLTPGQLPALRYDFIGMIAVKREENPTPWADLNEENNQDHTKQLCGLLPWTIAESYSRLKSSFSYLKALEQGGGTPEEIANARQNIVYVMGVMGHYVGDAAQPLHTTKHYNGWVGDNPNGYTTERKIHSWIDGGFWQATGVPTAKDLESSLRTAEPVASNGRVVAPDQMFPAIVEYIQNSHVLVEPLYKLEKEGALTPGNEQESQGKAFLEKQVIAGAQMLGDLWVSAWQQAPEDTYLLRTLAERANSSQAATRSGQ